MEEPKESLKPEGENPIEPSSEKADNIYFFMFCKLINQKGGCQISRQGKEEVNPHKATWEIFDKEMIE